MSWLEEPHRLRWSNLAYVPTAPAYTTHALTAHLPASLSRALCSLCQAENLDLEDGEEKGKKVIRLERHHKVKGFLVFLVACFSVFLMVGWRPKEHM